jgi:Thiamine pyrophosphate-requiring enzymes [acetolactate synthase, pyruvate dehydrogenase (cytochrome), glyoxylate carboligase, phosphonopyruvate decarboxylase]
MVPHISKAIKDADVIIGINIRFGEATTKAWNLLNIPFPNQKIIHIHASDKELGKIYQPDISFHAGPNIFSSALLGIKLDKSNKENRIKWLKKLKVSYKNSLKPPKQDSPVDMSEIMSWLQKNLKEDVIITNGAGNFALWPNKVFTYGSKQNLLAPQSGAMGYGLPAAIAACIAHPNRQVICFTGDGDIQMCLSELGTCVENNINPIIIILNNNSYGTIRMHQERNYPGRVYATNLKNPDFSNIAKAYGLIGIKVNKTKDFAKAFKKNFKIF